MPFYLQLQLFSFGKDFRMKPNIFLWVLAQIEVGEGRFNDEKIWGKEE